MAVGGESCDDGNLVPGDGCDAYCQIESGYACGDGVVAGSEACDDGNYSSGDGCSAQCQIEPGWSCSGSPTYCRRRYIIYVDSESQAAAPTGASWDTAYSDLQAGIDRAEQLGGNDESASLEVWVRMGTYSPYVSSAEDRFILPALVNLYGGFIGNEVLLEQRLPWSNTTTLDGEGRVDSVVEAEWADYARVDGFRITGAGGGGGGGAISIRYTNYLVIDSCIFEDNDAITGGALRSVNTRYSVARSIFRNNSVDLGGGAVRVAASLFSASDSVFVGNSSPDGGAIEVDADSEAFLSNCTFYGNTAGSNGAAIFSYSGGDTHVRNSIIWGNGDSPLHAAGAELEHCVVEGGADGVQVLDLNPRFVNASGGNLRLSAGSPCIDSGNSSYGLQTDLFGNPRRDDPATANTGAGQFTYWDMGAFEFQ